ncbi:MAG: hypothetical protein K8I30_15600 [Anaerolineae bacterium]|nr:hypothetical protein [Anaerolineae bacterium]
MASSEKKLDPDRRAALLAEYATLREEILRRIELRQQLISITLTIAAVFLGVGLGSSTVAFVFPPLAALLALAWRQNDFRTRRLAEYIREHQEKEIDGLGWERYCQTNRRDWRGVVIAHAGTFLLVQLLAVGVGFFTFRSTWPEISLLVVDIISMVFVVLALVVFKPK